MILKLGVVEATATEGREGRSDSGRSLEGCVQIQLSLESL